MSIIIRCCLFQCYLFMSVIIMFMGGIYYKLFNFFSILFPNMYISSCIRCLYVYKLGNEIWLTLHYLCHCFIGHVYYLLWSFIAIFLLTWHLDVLVLRLGVGSLCSLAWSVCSCWRECGLSAVLRRTANNGFGTRIAFRLSLFCLAEEPLLNVRTQKGLFWVLTLLTLPFLYHYSSRWRSLSSVLETWQ